MITSTSSSQVKTVVALQKKSKARREKKMFIAEGIKMVGEAPADRVEKIYVSESFAAAKESLVTEISEKVGKSRIEIVSDNVFERMSDTQTPQGILAIVRMREYSLEDIIKTEKTPLIIGIENLQDPGNLGTIVRMGEAAGVTGIILSSNSTDIYNSKTVRSTMGSLYRVPFVYVDDFTDTVECMKKSGIEVYAAHLNGNKQYTEPDYTSPTAFLIGNEGNGLTEKTAEAASQLIKIPMSGSVESLNAAVACTVLVYEAVRQRF